jgi:hypothetical protein
MELSTCPPHIKKGKIRHHKERASKGIDELHDIKLLRHIGSLNPVKSIMLCITLGTELFTVL